MKTCFKCKQEKKPSDFNTNKLLPDGLTTYCKSCNKKSSLMRRRELSFLLGSIPKEFHVMFEKAHAKWERSGFESDLKPIFDGKTITTKKERSMQKFKPGQNVEMYENGFKTGDFISIAQASAKTGTSAMWIKYSHKYGAVVKNGVYFKIL